MKEHHCCCERENVLSNPSHLEHIPQLNRVSGQIEGIKNMITINRYCPEILIQLKAARAALKSIESNILIKHLGHCVARSFDSETEKEKRINELKVLFDRFGE